MIDYYTILKNSIYVIKGYKNITLTFLGLYFIPLLLKSM